MERTAKSGSKGAVLRWPRARLGSRQRAQQQRMATALGASSTTNLQLAAVERSSRDRNGHAVSISSGLQADQQLSTADQPCDATLFQLFSASRVH